MSNNSISRLALALAFGAGLLAVGWVGAGFLGTNAIALAMTVAIAVVYLLGALEVWRFRADTAAFAAALAAVPQPLADLGEWLPRVPASLRDAVRMRIEGERVALPGLSLAPYLAGLLVMLGMLGTFLGMVVTFKGAVLALQGSADLQAIRAVLAEPVKGLALSFGTSVAGVAASAMLGLMAAIVRRERIDGVRALDARIAVEFRPFTLVQQRQESTRALQAQAEAIPAVARQLEALAAQLERRNQQLDAQLLERQEQFHREVSVAYTALARSVEQTLNDSLGASARAAGESIGPLLETALRALGEESRGMQERLGASLQERLDALAARFGATAEQVSASWAALQREQARGGEQLIAGLGSTLAEFGTTFEQRATALVEGVRESAARAQAAQERDGREQLAAWSQTLETTAAALAGEWQRAGAQTLAGQQAAAQALQDVALRLGEEHERQAGATAAAVERLLAQSAALLAARTASEAQWVAQQGERMDGLAALWRSELAALRGEEAARGEVAVARLAELQAALASQLATLGAALEEPLARLMQTAVEVPRSAAELIAQLRTEMSGLAERDNLALRERAALLEGLDALLQSVHRATSEQRAAIESLVASAGGVLEQVGRQFADTVGAQAVRAEAVAAQVAGSAIEVASLGEAFHHGVRLFSETGERLLASLQGIEGALGQSMARSDEQLAYYVAQAREVVDLSISAQQGILEDLRLLHAQAAARDGAGLVGAAPGRDTPMAAAAVPAECVAVDTADAEIA